jgi:5-methylcytosine-specific restriction endonuclease McrBC regulatory subunit McrC
VPQRDSELGAVKEITSRLEAERSRQQMLISLQEQSRSNFLNEYQQKIVASQPEQVLRRLELRKNVEWTTDGYRANLLAGNQIGVMRLVDGKDYLDIIVEPKVGNASFLRILEFCLGSVELREEALAYESKAAAPAFLTNFVVRQIESFLAAKRYRNYSLKFDNNCRTPKGRLDIRRYAYRQLPKAHFDIIPCEYFDFSENVFENQVIASTLLRAGRLAASFAPEVRTEVAGRIAQARRYLPGVEARRIGLDELNRFKYDRRNAPFKRIHDLCRVLLFNSSVSLLPGRLLSFMSFTLNMSDIFEQYVRRVFQKVYGSSLVPSKTNLRRKLYGTGSMIALDGMVKRVPPCVIECKYKLVENPNSLNFDEGALANADIYQCVAYANHCDVQAAETLLCYPSSIRDGPPVQLVGDIRSFVGSTGRIVPITIVLVNLGSPPLAVVESMSAALQKHWPSAVPA